MTLEAGALLGRYRIESLIGRGGMGAVYLATDTQLERRVALKVLSPELTDDARFRERFITESRIAASLDHPNIVPVYEAGEIDGQLFIAMRYIDGHDLSDVVAERGALPIGLAVRIVTAVAAALDAAHAKGLVHRDVKPGNVLLAGTDAAPHVYLTDFGLTKRLGDASMTAAGQIVGSIGYVAPEQVEGRPVDARTDVYSLGCLAYEILAGAQPFRRDSEMAVLMAHVQDPPPSLLAARPELPEALDAAIARAMAKDPAARFASAGEFAAAVSEAVAPEGGALTRGFLFADLRGYTAYVESHGDGAASALLDVYRRMMRDTIAHHGGAEIKTEGDSFYVVFPSASGAVMCGLSVVAAAAAQSQAHPEQPIRVGVGVNAGEAVAAAEGYVGSAVNIAARVCAQAKAGEVLVTDTVRGLTRTSGRLSFTPVGRRALKGIAEPMALFRAEPAGSRLMLAPGGRGPWWRRPSALAGMGGVLVLGVVVVLATKGGFGSPGASPSASAGPSLPPAVAVERIAYTQVRSQDPTAAPSCQDMEEGRAFLLDPAGAPPIRITRGGDDSETHLAWSADGSQLAFIGSSPWRAATLYLLDVATGLTIKLLPEVPPQGVDPFESIESLSWGPDRTSLVFAWGQQVWDVGTDGKGLHSLGITFPSQWALQGGAVLLPDGRIAALVNDLSAQYSTTLAIAPGPGGELAPVPWMHTGFAVAGLGWSPDRTRVAFIGADVAQVTPDRTPTWYLYIANVDGSELRRVTPVQITEMDALNGWSVLEWSPDGRQIILGSGTLSVVNAASGEARELPGTPGRAACWPAWGRTTTALLPQPTPTLAPGATPAPQPYHEGLLDPGVYVTDLFKPRIQFVLPTGWKGFVDSQDQLVLLSPDMPKAELDVDHVKIGIRGSCIDSSLQTRILTDSADLMAFLKGHPNLTVGQVQPYNAPGVHLSGLSLGISVSAPPTQADCPASQPQHIHPEVPLFEIGPSIDVIRNGVSEVVYAFDVDGAVLTFNAYAPPDQFDQFNRRVQQIIETLIFP